MRLNIGWSVVAILVLDSPSNILINISHFSELSPFLQLWARREFVFFTSMVSGGSDGMDRATPDIPITDALDNSKHPSVPSSSLAVAVDIQIFKFHLESKMHYYHTNWVPVATWCVPRPSINVVTLRGISKIFHFQAYLAIWYIIGM